MRDSKRLTAAGARKVVATATTRAQEAGIAVTVAVVDAGGHLVLLERMDGGKFHTVHSATTKAVCAASNKRSTGSEDAALSRLMQLIGLKKQPRPSSKRSPAR